jgi:hypothetical protein
MGSGTGNTSVHCCSRTLRVTVVAIECATDDVSDGDWRESSRNHHRTLHESY